MNEALTMTESPPSSDPNRPGQPTITELVSGILTDAQRLIKQQVEMLRAEVKEDVRRTKAVAQFMGVGAVLLTVGALHLTIAAVFLLNYLAPALPLWACWAIVGGTACVLGLIAVLVGRSKLNSFSPLPDKSFNALQENVSWVTNRQN